jgi:hypothetical protein
MVFELIGTWLIVGFFSAIGWNVADETVNKPIIDPWLEKKMQKTDTTTLKPTPPVEQNK